MSDGKGNALLLLAMDLDSPAVQTLTNLISKDMKSDPLPMLEAALGAMFEGKGAATAEEGRNTARRSRSRALLNGGVDRLLLRYCDCSVTVLWVL